jgi:hypothetical protein
MGKSRRNLAKKRVRKNQRRTKKGSGMFGRLFNRRKAKAMTYVPSTAPARAYLSRDRTPSEPYLTLRDYNNDDITKKYMNSTKVKAELELGTKNQKKAKDYACSMYAEAKKELADLELKQTAINEKVEKIGNTVTIRSTRCDAAKAALETAQRTMNERKDQLEAKYKSRLRPQPENPTSPSALPSPSVSSPNFSSSTFSSSSSPSSPSSRRSSPSSPSSRRSSPSSSDAWASPPIDPVSHISPFAGLVGDVDSSPATTVSLTPSPASTVISPSPYRLDNPMDGGIRRKLKGRKSRGRKSRGRKSRGRKSRGRKSRGRKSRKINRRNKRRTKGGRR